jgi:hypothetical protein
MPVLIQGDSLSVRGSNEVCAGTPVSAGTSVEEESMTIMAVIRRLFSLDYGDHSLPSNAGLQELEAVAAVEMMES